MNQNSHDVIGLSVSCFDTQYRLQGMGAQRSYPNESLIQFIASRYFKLGHQQRKDIKVLDVGCGSGANLWMMAKEGLQVYGLDSSAAALELARQHLHEKWSVMADLRVGSFTALPYEDAYFDAVVDVVSLQHLSLKDARLAIGEIARVLKPSGEFFSYRLSDHSVQFADLSQAKVDVATLLNIADVAMPLANNGPIAFWSPSLAGIVYEEVGMKLLSCERFGRTYSNGQYIEYLSLISKNDF
jgi:SAM-dependent methyltransferase